MTFRIGLLIFPNITQLDATGPYEVFIKFPDAEVRLIWKSLEPVKAGGGMLLTPDTTFDDCPQPPFNSGSPDQADVSLVERTRRTAAARQTERAAAVGQAAEKLRLS